MEIRRVTRVEDVVAAGRLFDAEPLPDATERFLAAPDHHLLLAYLDESPVGMVTGVETAHPDKGVEMFLYELGVDEPFRGRGVGGALVRALADLARARGCYGMWVLADADNDAALATYRGAGGDDVPAGVMFQWEFDRG